jgi:hypothetical protein
MAYPLNIFFVLSKSLLGTPESIIETRHHEYMDTRQQFLAAREAIINKDQEAVKRLEEILNGMGKAYILCEHYENRSPTPLSKQTTDALKVATTRLIIVAHGDAKDPRSVAMDQGDEKKPTAHISPQVLASWVRILLNETPVDRISLHICFAAKLHPPPPNSSKPPESFALTFSRYVGKMADSVSARTNNLTTRKDTGKRVTSDDDAGPYQYRQSLHKVIYFTGVGATPKAADYRQKEARDKLVKQLLEECREQEQKDMAAKYLRQFNADQ